eukprot:gene1165-2671_t
MADARLEKSKADKLAETGFWKALQQGTTAVSAPHIFMAAIMIVEGDDAHEALCEVMAKGGVAKDMAPQNVTMWQDQEVLDKMRVFCNMKQSEVGEMRVHVEKFIKHHSDRLEQLQQTIFTMLDDNSRTEQDRCSTATAAMEAYAQAADIGTPHKKKRVLSCLTPKKGDVFTVVQPFTAAEAVRYTNHLEESRASRRGLDAKLRPEPGDVCAKEQKNIQKDYILNKSGVKPTSLPGGREIPMRYQVGERTLQTFLVIPAEAAAGQGKRTSDVVEYMCGPCTVK